MVRKTAARIKEIATKKPKELTKRRGFQSIPKRSLKAK